MEPVSISSRGIRITARVQHLAEFEEPTFLLRLNCKEIHFDMRPRGRLAIYVTKRVGVGDVYTRIKPELVAAFNPNAKFEDRTIFAL